MKQGSDDRFSERPSVWKVREASLRGAGFVVASIVSRGLIRIASIVVLARLLTPPDFGLVAMGATAVNLLLIVADCGLTMAATQRPTIDSNQLSKLFWLNLCGGVLFGSLAIALSPLLVLLFGDHRVMGVVTGLSVTLVATAVGAQHEAILRRRLRYGFLNASGVASLAFGFTAGVVFALLGFGYWALVWSQVLAITSRTALLWVGTGWRPVRPCRGVHIRGFLEYGGRYIPGQLLDYCTNWIDGILIALIGGAFDLGIYRKGRNIAMMPVDQLRQPFGRMVISSLSRLQDNFDEFRRFHLYAVAVLCLGASAIIGLVAVEAPAIVNLLLGPQWVAAIPILRWLALAAVVSALGVTNDWLLIPLGEVTTLLGLRVLRLSIVIVGLVLGSRWGTVGVAAGYGLGSCVSVIIELFWGTAGKDLHVGGLIGALVRPIIAAMIAGGVVLYVPNGPSLVRFLVDIMVYVLLFFAVYALLPGGWQVLRRGIRATHATVRATR